MPKYFRDQVVKNIKVDEDLVRHLDHAIKARAVQLNNEINPENEENKRPFLTYVLRFDGKGIRYYEVGELLASFRVANDIDRLVVNVESPSALSSNRSIGEFLELKFDRVIESSCYIQVTSDNSDWVDSSFSSILDVTDKNKTKYGWARSTASRLLVQTSGVIVAFLISLWAAVEISPTIKLENSFILVFLFALLVFSNIWTHLSQFINSKIDKVFPNIFFYRPSKEKHQWLYQGLIVSLVAGVVLLSLNWGFGAIGNFLKGLAN
jgi:hypothetical protein